MASTLDPDGKLARKAVALIDAERDRIARAVAQQVRLMVPRYQDLSPTAHLRSNATVLSLVGDLLVKKRTDRLADFVEGVAQLRAASGFSAGDFLVGAMCFFPVLRRFLVQRAGSVTEGLVMFELLEQVTMPFVGRVAEIFAECTTDMTDPEGVDRTRFLSMLTDSFESTGPALRAMPIAEVDDLPSIDEDDGEDTAPGWR